MAGMARPPMKKKPWIPGSSPGMTVRDEGMNMIQLLDHIEKVDWAGFLRTIDEQGYAVLPRVLDASACQELAALYEDDGAVRARGVMGRDNWGRGEYKYLRYPLPSAVAALREALYPRLAPLANTWHERLRLEPRFPPALKAYLDRCHKAGQQRPTPLILKYEAG